jgi:hypothetical protein
MVDIGDLIKYTGYTGNSTDFGVVIEKGSVEIPKVSEIPMRSINEPYIVVMFFARETKHANLFLSDEGKTWFKVN